MEDVYIIYKQLPVYDGQNAGPNGEIYSCCCSWVICTYYQLPALGQSGWGSAGHSVRQTLEMTGHVTF